MGIEFYFTIILGVFMAVSLFVKFENFVEMYLFGSVNESYAVLNRFCSTYKGVDHESDEFYCFFKKSAFDFD
ncbi:hypothetical protein [Maridesulfovibrio hydrothermalis]|uniref:Uncharacterized protein n=1 Tax=Maridesulfovibrio hydrothermalis AM13 = DSM 14728 TaxID=1121451 RepID=L0RHR7_9BACT|nr:hypothetical protein [Maridesulfovibrio hydrothermalis]CCO25131.1 conserved protein of unknown function [Maridesulfovibrio hydrothermalis AM13 = DSM 14728]